MPTSIARQTERQLGGSRSVLVRQQRDHQELDRLVHAIDASTGRERLELLEDLARLVFPHAFAEESVLWPVIRRVMPEGPELTLQVEQEHQEINELWSQLERTTPGDGRHEELWPRIVALLREDVRDEEDEMLPRLQERVGRRELVRMGLMWEAVRRIAPTRPHPVVARRPPGNAVAALPLTVLDRSRDALDRTSRRREGRVSRVAGRLSSVAAGLAGRLEHVPPMTVGEDPSTRAGRTGRG
ncbi:hemerythrin domain-containing protein [Desertihabitans brevis]|uniref:Hemerythrin domain-containing protein n=1 Tax=Desertihabitans brevis TaxID=2268447 RepID=A0A367YV15_9ACTN|nr:hemerythrin domain-containing protein [Desertihabitans brevis]RCK69379.1 hemerythrin domain-containing protein [Desertihabitans brevis]